MSQIKRLFVFALFASIVSSASAAPVAVPTSVPDIETLDKEKIAAAPDANPSFTPLLLPKDAAERGISLSGAAKVYRSEQGKYQMGCGCILVHANEPMTISTCRANIVAKPGATIVISAKKDVTRVLNLSDRKRDSVRILFGKNHVSLNPGEELAVVSSQASNVEKAATEFVIRYRNAQPLTVSSEYKAVMFEFSLADAMKHCLIFQQLSASPRKEDRVLLHEIIKTAAAVNTMYGHSRPKYSHGDSDTIASDKRTVASDKSTSQLANKQKKQSSRIALSSFAE